MTGNPTRTSGYFYEAFNKMRDRFFTMKVASSDSTQVSKTFMEDMKLKYGEDSNIYRVRVLGEWPEADDDVVIPWENGPKQTTMWLFRFTSCKLPPKENKKQQLPRLLFGVLTWHVSVRTKLLYANERVML
jgi:hypothetical protein